ncbi:allophanate hydrolase [Cellulomonas composti]|uniref:Allophanate hydrolase n=1 Tax=Cellulomonas composti TaxID=266130 RepID=A0A511JCX6_9CELL|nr:allophanate hydrolase [Cellulomonas composti]
MLAPGLLTLVQDDGRPGWAHVGVGRAGAADLGALHLANRLVGNDEGAAGLEVLLGGLQVRARRPLTVALAGAPAPTTVRRGSLVVPVGPHAPLELAAGDVLTLGTPVRGLRTYLAVRGGVAVPPVLGSRSSDRLAGLGPEPLTAGEVLPVGPAPAGGIVVDVAPVRPVPDVAVLPVWPGPHVAWFGPHALSTLRTSSYRVTPATDRTALRLGGTTLRRAPEHEGRELAPVGLVRGAVQVPADGLPVVFGADHPVTGGYPVLAVVAGGAVDLLAQLRPGDPVRFAPARR